jgi:hypothetical protein
MSEPAGLFPLGVCLLSLGEVVRRRLRKTKRTTATNLEKPQMAPVDLEPAVHRMAGWYMRRPANGPVLEPLSVDEVLEGRRRRYAE